MRTRFLKGQCGVVWAAACVSRGACGCALFSEPLTDTPTRRATTREKRTQTEPLITTTKVHKQLKVVGLGLGTWLGPFPNAHANAKHAANAAWGACTTPVYSFYRRCYRYRVDISVGCGSVSRSGAVAFLALATLCCVICFKRQNSWQKNPVCAQVNLN